MFPTKAEVQLMYGVIREHSLRHWTVFDYYQLLINNDELDDVHQEILESRKRYGDAIELRGYTVFRDQEVLVGTHGGEEVRGVTVSVAVPILIDAGLAEQDAETLEIRPLMREGDRFTWRGQDYLVRQWVWTTSAVWANHDLPLYYDLRAERYHPDAATLGLE